MPLLLLPGMICDAAVWQPQIDALSREFEIIVASYPLLDSIGDMAEAALGAVASGERLAVVGHSMGGRVAQEIARRVPERVAGLALMGTDFRGPKDEDEREREMRARSVDLEDIRTRGMPAFAEDWARRLVAPHRRSETSLTGPIAAMALRHGAASFEAHARAGANRPDYSDLLATLECPTLIVAGDEDTIRPVATHELMAARIRTGRLAVLERCGHMMSLERPDAVSELLREWLGSLPGVGRSARPS